MLRSYLSISELFTRTPNRLFSVLRWLDWIFWGGYLPSLSINYVAKSKDMGKRFPQLYYIKMKNSYDLLQSESPWQLNDTIWFLFIFAFLCIRSFFKKSLKGVCTWYNCLNYGKV